ncbi:terpene synthase [Hymenopellis radicata]|nr:terpene synthase [Hymenopellis radicata]
MSYSPLTVPASGKAHFTDYSKWRLVVGEGGRHTWKYLKSDQEANEWPQTTLDKFWLGLPTNLPELPKARDPLEAAQNGYTFYKQLQAHDGHWPGEYGGPMFLLPGLVIGSYVSGMGFEEEERLEMIRYLFNRANPEDGGWGMQSTMFGTALNYVALRILGVDREHPVCVKARGIMHKLGMWRYRVSRMGKFWLAILNVYEWEGLNPVPPELWLLPDSIPFHPHKWWIHTRTVYAPMSYLYGIKFKAEENDLILSLREELYTKCYYSIYWPSHRNNVCERDLYSPHSLIYDVANVVLAGYESCTLPPLRKAACNRAYHLIVLEDENTGYQTLGPVSKMMNLVARVHVEGRDSKAYRLHKEKRLDFMWIGDEGMMMTGTNGSQLWDVGFITQAVVETGLVKRPENQESLFHALTWLEKAQILDNPRHFATSYRHATKGAWGFSTKEQGYTVSDCTGEGLKATLYIQDLPFAPKLVPERRLCDAVDVMLSLQNPGGGFASYEVIRGPAWLELLNPAEVFADIMIEYTYPECTTSVITALSHFRQRYPHYRSKDIDRTIKDAVVYLHKAQYPEGVWLGSWGICFTYATQFALESLSLVGETYETSAAAKKACDYLVSKQRADGGWGESYKTCEQMKWVEHAETQMVQTCWAAMSLMYAKYPYAEPIQKAVRLVMDRQLPDGSWPQEAIEGVFNKTCAIAYPNFKFSFPIWMLGKAHAYLLELSSRAKVDGNGNLNGKANGKDGHANGNGHLNGHNGH